MPPKLYLVRHAQGEHNVTHDWTLPDPTLTPLGKSQCTTLLTTFPHHTTIDLIISSPLRRALETTALAFAPTLARPGVRCLVHSLAQEVGDAACDTGLAVDALKASMRTFAAVEGLDAAIVDAMDYSDVEGGGDGWRVKSGYWAYEYEAIAKRAADLRAWLWGLPEAHILVVTHGLLLHFLTEDWEGIKDPLEDTTYANCEVREFVFTATGKLVRA